MSGTGRAWKAGKEGRQASAGSMIPAKLSESAEVPEILLRTQGATRTMLGAQSIICLLDGCVAWGRGSEAEGGT